MCSGLCSGVMTERCFENRIDEDVEYHTSPVAWLGFRFPQVIRQTYCCNPHSYRHRTLYEYFAIVSVAPSKASPKVPTDYE